MLAKIVMSASGLVLVCVILRDQEETRQSPDATANVLTEIESEQRNALGRNETETENGSERIIVENVMDIDEIGTGNRTKIGS